MGKNHTLTSKYGKCLLKSVRDAETNALAARTALAVARYDRLVAKLNEREQIAQEASLEGSSSVPSGGQPWTRHDFPNRSLQAFSRGNGEVLTIRESPSGEGYIIDYDEPVEVWPE
jgi:hypothetical protein